MTARIIDGKAVAAAIEGEIKEGVRLYAERTGQSPRLTVVLLGDDPASRIYVRRKQEACARVGIMSNVVGEKVRTPSDLVACLNDLFIDDRVHGVLLQLPLPQEFGDPVDYFWRLDPCKDVDVFHPWNVGRLVQGKPDFEPCTPAAISELIHRSDIPLAGKHVVVINRSNVVGKPLSSMLIQDHDFANATVTVCHDRTPPKVLQAICLSADIIVVAVGRPNFLTREMVTGRTGVVDVGTNRTGDRIVGDASPELKDVVSWLTPVPGGVGPVTISMLLKNTLKAASTGREGSWWRLGGLIE